MAYKTTQEILDFYRSQSGVKGNSASDLLDFYNGQQKRREEAAAAREEQNRANLFKTTEAEAAAKALPPSGYTEAYFDKNQPDHPEKMFGSSFDNGSYEARLKTMADWLNTSGAKYMTPESLSNLQGQAKRGEVKEWGITKPQRSAVKDFGANLAGGIVSSLKSVTDLAGVDNAASQVLGNASEFYQANTSAAQKNDLKLEKEQLAQLGEDEYLKRFGTAALNAVKSPGRTIATTAGQLLPLVVGGAALGAAKVGATASAALLGGASGAGSVKGGIADKINEASDEALLKDPNYRALRETMSVDDAKKAFATKASSYSESGLQIALGGAIGVASGAIGSVEKGLVAAIGKKATAKEALQESFKMAALKEVATEIPEEMSQTALSNIGANKGGADIKTLEGVAEAGGTAAVSALVGSGALKAIQSSGKKTDAPAATPVPPAAPAATVGEAFKRAALVEALKSGDVNAIEEATIAAEGAGIDIAQVEAEVRGEVYQESQAQSGRPELDAVVDMNNIASFDPTETGNKPLTEAPKRAIAEIQAQGAVVTEATAKEWAIEHEKAYSQYVKGEERAQAETFIDGTVKNILATAIEDGVPLRSKSQAIGQARLDELQAREPDYATRDRFELGDRRGVNGEVRPEADYRKSQSDLEGRIDFTNRQADIQTALGKASGNEKVLSKIEEALGLPEESLPNIPESFDKIKTLPIQKQEEVLGIKSKQAPKRYRTAAERATPVADARSELDVRFDDAIEGLLEYLNDEQINKILDELDKPGANFKQITDGIEKVYNEYIQLDQATRPQEGQGASGQPNGSNEANDSATAGTSRSQSKKETGAVNGNTSSDRRALPQGARGSKEEGSTNDSAGARGQSKPQERLGINVFGEASEQAPRPNSGLADRYDNGRKAPSDSLDKKNKPYTMADFKKSQEAKIVLNADYRKEKAYPIIGEFAKLKDFPEGRIYRARENAKALLGINVDIKIESFDGDANDAPARYMPGFGIQLNANNKITSVPYLTQVMVEEMLHAIDAVDGKSRAFQSGLFSRDSVIYNEVKSYYDRQGNQWEFLEYPLDIDVLMSNENAAAEMFANLGVLYLADKKEMAENLPIAHAQIVRTIAGKSQGFDGLSRLRATSGNAEGFASAPLDRAFLESDGRRNKGWAQDSKFRELLLSHRKDLQPRSGENEKLPNGTVAGQAFNSRPVNQPPPQTLSQRYLNKTPAEINQLSPVKEKKTGEKTTLKSLGLNIAQSFVDFKAYAKAALLDETLVAGASQELVSANTKLVREMIVAANKGAVVTERLQKSIIDPLEKKIKDIAEKSGIDADHLRNMAGEYAAARHSLDLSQIEEAQLQDTLDLATEILEQNQQDKAATREVKSEVLELIRDRDALVDRARSGAAVSINSTKKIFDKAASIAGKLLPQNPTKLAQYNRLINKQKQAFNGALKAGDIRRMLELARDLTTNISASIDLDKARAAKKDAQDKLDEWNKAQAEVSRVDGDTSKSADIALPGGLTKLEASIIIEQRNSDPVVQVADLYVQSFKDVNKDAVARGAISQESVDVLEAANPNYVSTSGDSKANEDASLFFGKSQGWFAKREGARSFFNTQNTFNNIVAKTQQAGNQTARKAVSEAVFDSLEAGSTLFEKTTVLDTNNVISHVNKAGLTTYIKAKDTRIGEAFGSIVEEQSKSLIAQGATNAVKSYGGLVTKFVPAFALTNFVRDFGTRFFNFVGRTDIKDAKGDAIGYAGAQRLRAAFTVNAFSPANWALSAKFAWNKEKLVEDADLKELRSLGGLLTFTDTLKTEKDVTKKFQQRFASKAVDKLWTKGLNHYVTAFNQMFETQLMLASYKAYKAAGLTKEDAAANTLDMMNFGQRGKITNTYLRPLYVFANPAAQDALQIKRTLYKNGKLNIPAVAEFTALAGLLAFAYAMSRESDEEDQFGNKLIDSQGAGLVGRNLLIPDGKGGYYKAPVPFGLFQIANVMGVSMARANDGVYTPAEAAGEMATAWLKSFAVTGTSDAPLARDPVAWAIFTLTPTLAKPAVSVMANKDSFGNAITNPLRSDRYKSDQGKFQTPEKWKELATTFREVAGIDIAPETIKTLIDGYAIGIANLPIAYAIDKKGDAEAKGIGSSEFEFAWQALGASRFAKNPNDVVVTNHYFYKAASEANGLEQRMNSELTTIPRESLEEKVVRWRKAGGQESEVALLLANKKYETERRKFTSKRQLAYNTFVKNEGEPSDELKALLANDMQQKASLITEWKKYKEKQ